mgnify:CR=1 FL=1
MPGVPTDTKARHMAHLIRWRTSGRWASWTPGAGRPTGPASAEPRAGASAMPPPRGQGAHHRQGQGAAHRPGQFEGRIDTIPPAAQPGAGHGHEGGRSRRHQRGDGGRQLQSGGGQGGVLESMHEHPGSAAMDIRAADEHPARQAALTPGDQAAQARPAQAAAGSTLGRARQTEHAAERTALPEP